MKEVNHVNAEWWVKLVASLICLGIVIYLHCNCLP